MHPYTPFIAGENELKAMESVFCTLAGPTEVDVNTDTLVPLPVLRGLPSTLACKLNSPGLSTTHSMEKEALGCMLNLLPSPSIAVREKCSTAEGGDVRSVTSVRDPVNRTQWEGSILQCMRLHTTAYIRTKFVCVCMCMRVCVCVCVCVRVCVCDMYFL